MANQSLVRHINERRLLGALRVFGALPRAELARRLFLTRAAVTSMVDDLMQRNLVREELPATFPERRRDVGRPGVDIGLQPDGAYFLGVEVGVGMLHSALIDLTARTVEAKTERFPPGTAPETVVTLVARQLAGLRARPEFGDRIRGICVSVPGLVRGDGFVINLPIVGWKQVDLAQLLAEVIDLPIHVENNANAAAFGHVYSHPRAGQSVMVYLTIGTGCGGAVIIEDRLLRGDAGHGSEFGHLRVSEDGPLCDCGQRGCLQTFVNLAALQRYATDEAVLSGAANPRLPGRIAEMLAEGNLAADAAVNTLARYLTHGLTSIVNIFNPAEVVIGGTMLPLLDAILARVEGPLAKRLVPGMPMPTLTVSRIGEFEGAIGAAALVHHAEFDLSNLDLRI